ncbi:DUF4167 domain-containing protein [Candidatus Pelagibacter sp.]|jgi:hypothetical protein|nr:DUF4167 domain-containing protein [Candidatus Pelagibacter bacterium]MDA8791021.1 DUF4167 domain-containing protein [Candidatus Pelagibacter bacterium]MDC3385375.1 DUF4167 domain-containing protein [Candidatus Pelagibacter sp.]
MVTFRNNNNNRRNNFRRNDRNFKSNGDRPKYGSNFSNNENFQRKVPGRNNHNAPKLIEKYENLAREALSSGDKILSENYFQHADHFTRILNEQEAYKKARYASTNEINKELPEDNVTEEEVIVEESKSKVVSKKEEPETKVAAAK